MFKESGIKGGGGCPARRSWKQHRASADAVQRGGKGRILSIHRVWKTPFRCRSYGRFGIYVGLGPYRPLPRRPLSSLSTLAARPPLSGRVSPGRTAFYRYFPHPVGFSEPLCRRNLSRPPDPPWGGRAVTKAGGNLAPASYQSTTLESVSSSPFDIVGRQETTPIDCFGDGDREVDLKTAALSRRIPCTAPESGTG